MDHKILCSKFINLLTKQGKKQAAKKIVVGVFNHLKIQGHEPAFIFIQAFSNVIPLVGLGKVIKSGQVLYIPKIIPSASRNYLTIRWFITASTKTSKLTSIPFSKCLANLLIESCYKTGVVYKKKQEYHFNADNNRVFLFMRIQQLIRKPRKSKKISTSLVFVKNPQLRGSCLKVFTQSPRKPNSAIRKVARITLSTNITITAYIPGEGHSLQEHASVLVKGGGAKDLPGVKFSIVRGALDCLGVASRKTSRSKYGVKKG